MASPLGVKVNWQIEVEDNPLSVLLVLDRKCDVAVVPWQDAFRLAGVMEKVVQDVRAEFPPIIGGEEVIREQGQVRLHHHLGLVALVVDWTDRIRFRSLDAFLLVARALRLQAQDAYLEERKGVRMVYGKDGMLRQIVNKNGCGQRIR